MKDPKKIEREFNKLTKKKFLDPKSCTELAQTRQLLSELNEIIKHFETKFNFIPSSAHLLFSEYNDKQEKMLFEQYKKDYNLD